MKIEFRRLKVTAVEKILADANLEVVLQEALQVVETVKRNQRLRYRSDREVCDGTIRVPAELLAALIQYKQGCTKFFADFNSGIRTVCSARISSASSKSLDEVYSDPGGKGLQYVASETGRITTSKVRLLDRSKFSKNPFAESDTLAQVIWVMNDPNHAWTEESLWTLPNGNGKGICHMTKKELQTWIERLDSCTINNGAKHPAITVMLEALRKSFRVPVE